MGGSTREEIEALLRDNLKIFCEKNFEFENELTVDAHISFSSDRNAAIVCDVQETIPALGSPPYEGSTQIVTRTRRTRKHTSRNSYLKKPITNSSKITKIIASEKTSDNTQGDKPVVVIKTELPYNGPSLETSPSEVVIVASDVDYSVSCPLVASTSLKDEPPAVVDDDNSSMDDPGDGADDDHGSDPDFTGVTPKNPKPPKCSVKTTSLTGKHACSICGKVYNKPNRLKVHERTHTGDRPYTCVKCKKSYRSAASLTIHTKKGCLDRRKKASLDTITQHIVDNFALDDVVMPKEKEDAPITPKRRDCKFCSRSFSKPSRLLSHERTHTGERPFSCTKCGKAYVSLQGLRTHYIRGCTDRRKKQMNTIRTPPQHVCGYCGKVYPKRNRLLVHERTQHTGERPFLCASCGKSYSSRVTLNQHTMIHTTNKSFICTVCDTRFLLPYTLKIHMRVHTGERPHVCWHCGRAFRQYGSFQVHLRTHTKEKPLKCSRCDQHFAHRSLQLKHEMMHEGERQFSCTQCGKRFWTAHELKTHMRTHLGIKRHVCPTCNMRFTQISSLKRHVQGHLGYTKIHNCPMCGKTFTRAHQVSIHMKVHNADSPYRCQICHTNFKSMSSRRTHMVSHHAEQPQDATVLPNRVTSGVEVTQSIKTGSNPVQHQQEDPLHQDNPYMRSMLDPQQYKVPVCQPQLSLPIQFVHTQMAPMPPHNLAPSIHHVSDPTYRHTM